MAEILILGVIVSIIFYELTDIAPGGIIVPGLLVAYIAQPLRILYTVIIALAAFLIVKLLSCRFLVFGKRRFALMIIVSLLLYVSINFILGLFVGSLFTPVFSIAGVTVAGIIGNNVYKQGVVRTVPSLVIVTCFLELIILLLGAAGITI